MVSNWFLQNRIPSCVRINKGDRKVKSFYAFKNQNTMPSKTLVIFSVKKIKQIFAW